MFTEASMPLGKNVGVQRKKREGGQYKDRHRMKGFLASITKRENTVDLFLV
jgi:hypothetical protein